MAHMDDRELATQLFNRCWDLLAATRDDDDDVELLTAAFNQWNRELNAAVSSSTSSSSSRVPRRPSARANWPFVSPRVRTPRPRRTRSRIGCRLEYRRRCPGVRGDRR